MPGVTHRKAQHSETPANLRVCQISDQYIKSKDTTLSIPRFVRQDNSFTLLTVDAEIIAVGSELLTPYRQDTNSLYLTEKLNQLGLEVRFKCIVGDDAEGLTLIPFITVLRSCTAHYSFWFVMELETSA